MTSRQKEICRALIGGGRLSPPFQQYSRLWDLFLPDGTRQTVNEDTVQRMKNLCILSYRDDNGMHLGTLKPTTQALEEINRASA